MIIKCPHCDGKMRVDETKIPPGERVRVLCPHCSEISPVGVATAPDSAAAVAAPTGGSRQTADLAKPPETEAPKTGQRSAAPEQELCFPRDAFQNFRFPAEKESPTASKKKASSMARLVVWIVVSLAIIGLFALLVNLILPGPHGVKPFGQVENIEQSLPDTSGVSGRRIPVGGR
jgi:predicted Zn finger-like uncharacterized protein